MKLDRGEILRYLGMRGVQPEEQIDELIESACDELERVATARLVTRPADLEIFPGENTVCFLRTI